MIQHDDKDALDVRNGILEAFYMTGIIVAEDQQPLFNHELIQNTEFVLATVRLANKGGPASNDEFYAAAISMTRAVYPEKEDQAIARLYYQPD